jgi:glycosyltransferase involved in cell wall biosynthesis/SAM-dependent methyltransferase
MDAATSPSVATIPGSQSNLEPSVSPARPVCPVCPVCPVRGVVLLATYNEADSIGPVLAELDEAIRVLEREGVLLDVLLVDDNSPDGTADMALGFADRYGMRIEVLIGEKAGLGRALLRGFEHGLKRSDIDFFVTLDADGQHDPRQIPDLVRAFRARRSGITIGSRWARGGTSPGTSLPRMVLSRVGNLLFRTVTGTRNVHDATTSFRVIRPEVASAFRPGNLDVNGYSFFSTFIAIAQANGYSIDEVPIHFRPRYSGLSKLTTGDCTKFFSNLFAVREAAKAIRRGRRRAARTDGARLQAVSTDSEFGAAEELDFLADAKNFTRWIVDAFADAVHGDVLEVGAGIGTVASLLAATPGVRRVLAIEPATNLFHRLQEASASGHYEPRQVLSSSLVHETRRFDSVVYVSVLEHIDDHVSELRTARELLSPNGRLCVFVPACPALYGPIDRKSGHYRRYTKQELAETAALAGFEVEDIRYFDAVSLVPYWLNYKLLQTADLDRTSNVVFDRVLVPLARLTERLVPRPPIGKNLVMVARPIVVAESAFVSVRAASPSACPVRVLIAS